jgi:hypothetical protein
MPIYSGFPPSLREFGLPVASVRLDAPPHPRPKLPKHEVAPPRRLREWGVRPNEALDAIREAGPRRVLGRPRCGASNDARRSVGGAPIDVILGAMKRTIDDLPLVRVATLVALGEIGRDAKMARVRFGDDGIEHQVGVRVRSFPNGGFWAMLVCARCGGGAQRLRLLDDRPACGKCVRARGLIYRSQATRTEKRHAVTAPPRFARLNSDKPLRVHPRPGRTIDGRENIEFALPRSRIVARKHGIDRAKDQGL